MSTVFEEDFFVLDQGRTESEQAVIMVKNGQYCGYGYLEKEETIHQAADLEDVATGRYVKIKINSEVNGKPWASAAEIGVIGNLDQKTSKN